MVNLFGPLSSIVSKLLDKLIPNTEAKTIREKKALGRYLVRTAGIIDAYRQECTRLRKELHEYGRRPDRDSMEALSAGFERISHLTSEFAATVGEIVYLQLFDTEAEVGLVAGALSEFGVLWPGTYARLCFDADEAATHFSLTGAAFQAFSKEARSDSPIVVQIGDEQSRTAMLAHLNDAMNSLGAAHQRLSAFLAKNYAIWELFDVRDEYNRSTNTHKKPRQAKQRPESRPRR